MEIRDHRPDDQPEVFTPHRVLLQPNGETLYRYLPHESEVGRYLERPASSGGGGTDPGM